MGTCTVYNARGFNTDLLNKSKLHPISVCETNYDITGIFLLQKRVFTLTQPPNTFCGNLYKNGMRSNLDPIQFQKCLVVNITSK